MGIQRYMFFSIHNCDKHPEVPLMQMKTCTEQYLADSGLNYTIFRLCGFMQVHFLSLHASSLDMMHRSVTCLWSPVQITVLSHMCPSRAQQQHLFAPLAICS